FRLLHGPYEPPPLRKGDRTHCLYRDALIIITAWSDGRIPWPRCRAPGTHNRRASQGMHSLQSRAGCDKLSRMSEVTQILDAIGRGDAQASEQLLPMIYQELRRLAAKMLAQEPAGQTL